MLLRNIRASLFLLIGLCIFACNKIVEELNHNPLAKTAVAALSSDSVYNYCAIMLTGDQQMNGHDSAYNIDFSAVFMDSLTKQMISTQSVQMNARVMTRASDLTYSFHYGDTTTAILNEGVSLFGTSVKVKVTGSSAADTLTKVIYMPKRMFQSVNDFPKDMISNTSSLTINWPTDPANALGKVEIKVWYNASLSRFMSDSTLPATDKILTYVVADNGTYTIPLADIQQFSLKSYLKISIGRLSQATGTLPISHRYINYYATSSLTSSIVYLGCIPNWRNVYPVVLRCQQSNGANTGHQEQEQKDLTFCSPTANQFQWVDIGSNPTACPTTSQVKGFNTQSVNYFVKFTNQTTNAVTQYIIVHNTNGYYVVLGTIPAGIYTVAFNPQSIGYVSTFSVNGLMSDGTTSTATFTNVSINTATTTVSVSNAL